MRILLCSWDAESLSVFVDVCGGAFVPLVFSLYFVDWISDDDGVECREIEGQTGNWIT